MILVKRPWSRPWSRPRRRLARPASIVVALAASWPAVVGAASPTTSGAAGSTSPAVRVAALGRQVTDAEARLLAASQHRDGLYADLVDTRARLEDAEARTVARQIEAKDALARYATTRAKLERVAVRAYVGRGDLGELEALASADDLLDVRRRAELFAQASDERLRLVQRLREDEAAARAALEAVVAERRQLGERLVRLEQQIPEAEAAVVDAEAALGRARWALDRWTSVSAGPGTPILGRSRLSGDELAAWFESTGVRARTTVPIRELARMFVEEGAAEGVRGDVAFAQSVLETGHFYFPDYGQVRTTDNNFAGIGACDSCDTGYSFPDARSGVRAQIQLLRAYADAGLTVDALANPPVLPRLGEFQLRGVAPTWGGLTGTWATASHYGDAIFTVYFRILAWVSDHTA